MFSESRSFCFVGVSSSSALFVSDKDLNSNMDPDEFEILVRPAMEIYKAECQTSTPEDDHKQLSVQERDQEEDNKEHQEEQKQRGSVISSVPLATLKNLKLEIPSYEDVEGSQKDDSNEGFKTPTSSDHKIPVILECPGAPRKTKSRPATKRKACSRQIVLDLSKELESLFPIPFVVDLGSAGKNKKVKQCSENKKP